MSDRLWSWSLMGAVISAAGLPIYIYAPKYYADTYGVSLAAIGAVLFVLRVFDVVQDPVLGWVSERLRRGRGLAVAIAAALLGVSMLGLFAIAPPIPPLWWFALTIGGLVTAFSFLTINFYAQGVNRAADLSGGHVRLAAWRETGALLGICIAAIVPTVLTGVVPAPFAWFAVGFCVVTVLATFAMAPEWGGRVAATDPVPFATILRDAPARSLMILALVNATPLAVSSTLFLFYVDGRLQAPGWEGPLLVLFFLAAAVSSPGWSWLARRISPKRALLIGMVLAVVSFGVTLTLGPGDQAVFAVICIASGASIGADLTLLPAMFARRMADVAPNGGQGFGLWSLVNKFTLAFAAIALLPLLESSGFVSGEPVPDSAARMLTILYAGVPVGLKLIAIALLLFTPLEDDAG